MIVSSLLVASTLATATPFKTDADAIEYRQHAYSMIAVNFGDMGAMIKGKNEWDQGTFEMRAKNVHNLSLMTQEGFESKSTAKGDTKAKAKIWDEWMDFSDKQVNLTKNAKALAEVAKTSDKAAIKKAFMTVAKDCKSCHKAYRSK